MNERIERLIRRLPAPLRPVAELGARTLGDALEDRVPGLAAEMAFYLILSLPPLLVTVFAAVALLAQAVEGFDPVARISAQIGDVGGLFLTEQAAGDLQQVLRNVQERLAADAGQAILGFGLLTTLFSASRALRVTTVAITIAYDLERTRPGWQQFLYGLLITVGGLVAGVVIVPLLVAGPRLARLVAEPLGLGGWVAPVWNALYWPLAAIVATLLLAVLYHVAAPWRTPWRRDVPGAVLAMVIALLGSAGLRTYAAQAIGRSEGLFGPLAAPVVLLLWLYVMSFAVLIGAELNAEIERLWPTVRPDQPPEHEAERLRAADRERVS